MLALRALIMAAVLAWPALSPAGPREALAGSALAGVSRVPIPGIPGELRGRVLRSDGSPVTRFTVNANSFDDPQGRFRILVPPEGDFRVVVRADGFAANVIHVRGAAGKKLVMPEITLGQGEDLVGEVLDAETGRPVVAAVAALADPAKPERLRLVRGERVARAANTGFGGIFFLKQAPRGLLMLVVHHPDYLPEFVPVNTRERLPVVQMHRGGVITGKVQGPRGEPMPGIRVAAVSEAAADGGEAWTDAGGRYELHALRPGPYTVMARSSAGNPAVTPTPVQVADGRVASVVFEVKGSGKHMELPEFQLGAAAAPPDALALR